MNGQHNEIGVTATWRNNQQSTSSHSAGKGNYVTSDASSSCRSLLALGDMTGQCEEQLNGMTTAPVDGAPIRPKTVLSMLLRYKAHPMQQMCGQAMD